MTLEYVQGRSLFIQADLPGLDPDRDIAISIAHDILHICAHDPARPHRVDHVSDLRDGTYEREIALPVGTVEDHNSAVYRNGQLEVRAPNGSIVAARSVEIPIARG
jgi:HSP20 family protein